MIARHHYVVHWTLGILRNLQAFSGFEFFSALKHFPTHHSLTQTVGGTE